MLRPLVEDFSLGYCQALNSQENIWISALGSISLPSGNTKVAIQFAVPLLFSPGLQRRIFLVNSCRNCSMDDPVDSPLQMFCSLPCVLLSAQFLGLVPLVSSQVAGLDKFLSSNRILPNLRGSWEPLMPLGYMPRQFGKCHHEVINFPKAIHILIFILSIMVEWKLCCNTTSGPHVYI